MIARALHQELLDAALGYAEKGWPVFPLGGKKPHPAIQGIAAQQGREGRVTLKWGASNDPEVLRAYFDAMPDATGLGLLCGPESGVDVLDIDGEKGLASLRGLGYTLDDIKALGVPIVRTGREGDGFHAYFLADPERRVTSRSGKGERGGLDAKGGGKGYVVLPPSVHPFTQRPYSWEQQGVPQPWPEAILEAVTQQPAPVPAQTAAPAQQGLRFNLGSAAPIERARAYLATMPGAVSGQGGHDQAFNAACRCAVDFGLNESDTLALLHEWNKRCEPPWDDKELEHKAREAVKKAAGSSKKGALLNAPKKAAQEEDEERDEDRVASIRGRIMSPEALRAWSKDRPREWIVEGLLPTSTLAFVTGVEKESGKSTFVWALVGQAERGGEFLGRTLPKVDALILTEEDRADIEEKLEGNGIQRALVLPQEMVWDESMADCVAAVEQVIEESHGRIRILVVDTFAAFAQMEGDAESKAGAAQMLKPLRKLARKHNLLVMVIHHTSKNKDADGIRRNRGSTSLTGIVESSLEVRVSGDGNKRTLDLKARYGHKSWAVERVTGLDGFATYGLLGEAQAVKTATHEDAVMAWMDKHPGWHRIEFIARSVGGDSSAVTGAVRGLNKQGLIQRAGPGRSGKPFLYGLPGQPPPTPEQTVWAQNEADRSARNAGDESALSKRARELDRARAELLARLGRKPDEQPKDEG